MILAQLELINFLKSTIKYYKYGIQETSLKKKLLLNKCRRHQTKKEEMLLPLGRINTRVIQIKII